MLRNFFLLIPNVIVLFLLSTIATTTRAQSQLPLFWNVGGSTAWVDAEGNVWQPDRFDSGMTVDSACSTSPTAPFFWTAKEDLVCSRKEWNGSSSGQLNIAVPEPAMYEADLIVSDVDGIAGERILDVLVEGTVIRTGMDVVAEAEAPTTFFTLTVTFPVTDGFFTVQINAQRGRATLAGISLRDAGPIPFQVVDPPTSPNMPVLVPIGLSPMAPPTMPVPAPVPPPVVVPSPTLPPFASVPTIWIPTTFDFPKVESSPVPLSSAFFPLDPPTGSPPTTPTSSSFIPLPLMFPDFPPPPPPPLTMTSPPPPPPPPLTMTSPPPPPPLTMTTPPPPPPLFITFPNFPGPAPPSPPLTVNFSTPLPPPPPPLSLMSFAPPSSPATQQGSSTLGAKTTYSIDIGSSADYTDAVGQRWQADTMFVPASTPVINECPTHRFQGIPNPTMVCKFRSWLGSTTTGVLEFPVAASGRYDIELTLSEVGAVQMGERVVDVYIEGMRLFSDLDVMAQIGTFAIGIFTLTATQFVGDGAVSVEIRATRGNPVLAGLTIRPTPQRRRLGAPRRTRTAATKTKVVYAA